MTFYSFTVYYISFVCIYVCMLVSISLFSFFISFPSYFLSNYFSNRWYNIFIFFFLSFPFLNPSKCVGILLTKTSSDLYLFSLINVNLQFLSTTYFFNYVSHIISFSNFYLYMKIYQIC